MDSSLETAVLPPDLIRRCRDHVSRANFSNSVSYRGAERNTRLQSIAKMAECAACLYAGMDPLTQLRWVNAPDDGNDFRWGDVLIDVKHSEHAGYLIWPLRKNDLFEKKRFDVILFVSGVEDRFVLRGWTTKEQFRSEHQVADADHKLDEGTWYMATSDLWHPRALRESINVGWFA